MAGPGSQADEFEVEDCVVDDVVTFVGEGAVDVAQKGTDLLQRQRSLEHIDDDDSADLLHIIPLVLGGSEKTPLDPVLNGVGLKTCDAGNLTQGQTAGQEHGLKQSVGPVGIAAQTFQGGSGYDPVHWGYLLCFLVL